jgi:Putative Zn-dependent protease, contains TPR repeats
MNSISRCFLVCLMAVMTACAVNPVTGKKELSLMSAEQEVAQGEKLYGDYQQQQGGRYVVDPELTLYVNSVGQKLAKVSDRPDLPYEFVVLNNSVPNAWALPGGKIAINRGLLTILEDESQLAAVLGHEIVHAAARHSARQMTRATLLNVGLMAAGVAAQSTDYGDWIMAGAGVGASAYQAHYGRDQELEADKFGVQYMVKAGYDARGAVELQEAFVKLSEGQQSGFMENLFASHPPSQERVERNRELAASHSGGARNKSAYQAAIRQLARDAAAYKAHDQALAAAQKEDFTAAASLIDKAIQQQPKESLFFITKGQLKMAQKDDAAALQAFQQASKLNPEYYLGFLGAGILQKKAGQSAAANTSLQSSMKLLATPLAAYHLGELSLAAGDRNNAVSYFELAAQGTGEVAEAAKAQLSKLTQQN